jgi:hypothetical protein
MRRPRDHRQRRRHLRMNSVRRKVMATTSLAFDNAGVFRSEPTLALSSEASAGGDSTERFESRNTRSSLDQTERHMSSLKSRIDYLERRAASSVGATERELENLMRARDELSASAASLARLSKTFERPEIEESDPSGDWDGWNDY